MKLLRITSEDPNGNFDNILNTDLIIKPYSQIALTNASFKNNFPTLDINSNNDSITFNTGTGNHTAQLTHSEYIGTESDGLKLLQDMTSNLNAQLSLTGKEFGGQFKCEKTGGKIQIGYVISPFEWSDFDHQEAGGWTISGTSADASRIATNNSGAAVGNDSVRSISEFPITKGAGCFRTQINTLVQDGTANNGFRMVLSPSDPDDFNTPDLTAEQDKYSISCIPDPSDLTLFKYVFRNGDGNTQDLLNAGAKVRPQPPTQDGAGNASPTNDLVQLSVEGGSVVGKVFQTIAGTLTTFTAFSVVYDAEDLYALSIIKGQAAQTALYNPKITLKTDVSNSNAYISDGYDGLGVVPLPPTIRRSTFTLDLSACIPLAEFLGYERQATAGFVFTRPNYTTTATFQGGENYQLNLSESYVVQFQSANLESFDGFLKDRFSILKVIPNVNQNTDDRICNYESSSLLFIDLNNSTSMSLRNIRARILNSRLESIRTSDLSVLTMVIKEKNE